MKEKNVESTIVKPIFTPFLGIRKGFVRILAERIDDIKDGSISSFVYLLELNEFIDLIAASEGFYSKEKYEKYPHKITRKWQPMRSSIKARKL